MDNFVLLNLHNKYSGLIKQHCTILATDCKYCITKASIVSKMEIFSVKTQYKEYWSNVDSIFLCYLKLEDGSV